MMLTGSRMTIFIMSRQMTSQFWKSRAVLSTPFHSRRVKAMAPFWYRRPSWRSPFTTRSHFSFAGSAMKSLNSSLTRCLSRLSLLTCLFLKSFQSISLMSSFQI